MAIKEVREAAMRAVLQQVNHRQAKQDKIVGAIRLRHMHSCLSRYAVLAWMFTG